MGLDSASDCPECGAPFAWDGRRCHRCKFTWQLSGYVPQQEDTSDPAAVVEHVRPGGGPGSSQGVWLAVRNLAVLIGVLALVLLGGLIELGQIKQRAGWFGLRDFTVAYLAGSVAFGSAEVLQAVLLLRNQGRWTRSVGWVVSGTALWIPVSVGILLDALPNSVPRWLPASYLSYSLLAAALGLAFHWRFVKEMLKVMWAGKEIPPERYPLTSYSAALFDGALGGAFAAASCLLLLR